MNFFSLFEIAPRFAIDERALEVKFRALQAQTHPDKFASASDAERRAAEQRSALVNDAYKSLKDPVSRSAYLIEKTCALNPFDERNTKMPVHFLHAQIELREEIAEASLARNAEALERIAASLANDSQIMRSKIGTIMDDEGDYRGAIDAVRQLRFLQKVASEVDVALEKLDG